MKFRLLLVAAATTAATLLAACGDDSSGSSTLAPTTMAPTTMAPADMTATTMAPAATGAATDADVAFAQNMIAHHTQAVAMATLALAPGAGASAAVMDLATRIKAAQGPEIEMMSGWLSMWGKPMMMDTPMGHMTPMPGMMSDADMAMLATLHGSEFDAKWLEMMIAHHQGAVTQAQDIMKAGSNPDVLALADGIITAQQAEIAEMQQLLAK